MPYRGSQAKWCCCTRRSRPAHESRWSSIQAHGRLGTVQPGLIHDAMYATEGIGPRHHPSPMRGLQAWVPEAAPFRAELDFQMPTSTSVPAALAHMSMKQHKPQPPTLPSTTACGHAYQAYHHVATHMPHAKRGTLHSGHVLLRSIWPAVACYAMPCYAIVCCRRQENKPKRRRVAAEALRSLV